MIPRTLEDCRTVGAWRGLPARVLLELSELDAAAIARGDRFSEVRRRLCADRLRCVELRRVHGLGLLDKLRMP